MSTRPTSAHRWSKRQCAQARLLQAQITPFAMRILDLVALVERFDSEFLPTVLPVAMRFLSPVARILKLDFRAKVRKSQPMSVGEVNDLIVKLDAGVDAWNNFVAVPSTRRRLRRVFEQLYDACEPARGKHALLEALKNETNSRN